MFVVRLLVGVMWVLAAVAGHEMWTPRVIVANDAGPRPGETTSISIPIAIDATAVAESADEPGEEPRLQPSFDVYGNEIDEAVGDYRIDPQGEVYEWHSPETAILKLPSPGA